MDVFEAIKNRRSIRKYTSKKIENEKLNKILESARLAPSANNSQEWKFIAVTDKSKIKEIARTSGQDFIAAAPAVIVGCAEENKKVMFCGQNAYTINLSIAFSFMILEAEELGIGSCWIGHFNESKVKEILDIPDSVKVVALAPFGYPDETPDQRPRKDFKDVVSFEKYKQQA